MFVEITRGRSFKGLAQYCLHDVDRQGAERVSFVETRNLGTDNAQAAWRIMAAKHYLQDELKEKAGVGRGGAKDGKPVGHLLISWKDEEAEAQQLNASGMKQAAYGALRAIGADAHQAIIIGHTDTAHPHCHIIVNLIGDDGRLKKNWKEREKLSQFALKAEKTVHGEAIVKTREKNWLDRNAGETPAPVKKQPRHLYELEKAGKKCEQTQQFADEHKQKLAEQQQAKDAQKQRHKRHQETLLLLHQQRNRTTVATVQKQIRAGKSEVRRNYDQNWRQLLLDQEARRKSFDQNEQNLKGSVANAMKLIDWKQVLRRKKEQDQLRLRDAFQILTNEAARMDRLNQQQQVEQDKLRARQRQEEEAKEQALQKQQEQELKEQRKAYVRKAEAMKQRQARSHERLKEQQQRLTRERNEALKEFREREQQQKLDRVKELKQREEGARPQANDNSSRPHPSQNVEQPDKANIVAPEFQEAVTAPKEEPPARIRRERKERQPRQPRQPREDRQQKPQAEMTQPTQRPEPAPQTTPEMSKAPPEQNRKEHATPTPPESSPPAPTPQPEPTPPVEPQKNDFEERMMKQMEERNHLRDSWDRSR